MLEHVIIIDEKTASFTQALMEMKSPTFIKYHCSHFYFSTFLFSSEVERIELFIRRNGDKEKCMNEKNERNE